MSSTYANSITCMDPYGVKLPAVMPNDKLAMKFAMNLAYQADPILGPKVIWIHNTLCMQEYWVSEGLIPQVKQIDNMTIISEKPVEVQFDENDNIIPFKCNN